MNTRDISIPTWLISLTLTFLILIAMLWGSAGMTAVDARLYDFFTSIRQNEIPSPIVIIEIDRKSIQEMGPWPWPRSYLADGIKTITADKAKAIGLTLLYPARDFNHALKKIKTIRREMRNDEVYGSTPAFGRVDFLLKRLEREIDQDNLLRQAIIPAKNVVLPLIVSPSRQGEKPKEPTDWLEKDLLRSPPVKLTPRILLADFKNPFLALKEIRLPTDLLTTTAVLATAASRHGHVDHPADSDGVIRSEQLLSRYGDDLIPSLALQMALAEEDRTLSDLKIASRRGIANGILYGEHRISTSHDFKIFLDFDENKATINRYSFADLAGKRLRKGALTDKLVLIGITDPDFSPPMISTLHERTTPVEVCATSLIGLLRGNYVQRPGWAWFLESFVLLYLGFILYFIGSRVSTSVTTLVLVSFLGAWWASAFFIFMNNGFWLYVIPHTTLTLLGVLALLVNKYLAAPKLKRDENTETNKMLGLSFQGQGQLDMAFDSFRKCSLNDPSVKAALYNLALDFERKRMSNKAVSVYEYLLKGGKHKDAHDRLWRLKRADAKNLGPVLGNKAENTILMENSSTRPTLGRYEVIKELGKGAIGTVYLGRDPKINRKVAIKTLRYDEVDPNQLNEIKERFFREAEAAGRLSHPNIVTIYDAGEDYDITYMAMEYLDGHDLMRYCRKENLLAPKMVLNIIIRVAFALDYAHKHKVVHRDIKPANIMLTDKGHVKVTDFGIARIQTSNSTQTGVILGTPNYMSPEQVLGKKLDGRSDLFSLGAVFFELLTGEKPFKSDNIGNLMHNIASAKFSPIRDIRPDVPPCCEAIVNKLMTKSRTNRYTNAGTVVIEAQQCLENL